MRKKEILVLTVEAARVVQSSMTFMRCQTRDTHRVGSAAMGSETPIRIGGVDSYYRMCVKVEDLVVWECVLAPQPRIFVV